MLYFIIHYLPFPFAAMYILFRGIEHSIFNHPLEAMMGMFMMSLGEFADTYDSFQRTEFPSVPKVGHNLQLILCHLYLYYNFPYICLSIFANYTQQFLLDRLRRYHKLFVSTEGPSSHEFAFQFGLANFL